MRLRFAALALVSLAACRRHPRLRASASRAPHWIAHPATAPAARVDDRRVLRGAVRVEGERSSVAPWPAAPLVACARAADGWRFADADGALYRATTFTGPLTVTGELPRRAAPVARVARSEDALLVVDDRRDAWAVGPEQVPRRLPLARVIDGAFESADVALAVVEPGVLVRSTDGGRTFTAVPLAAGAAVGVTPTRVYTTEGPLRFEGGALVAADDDRGAPVHEEATSATRSALPSTADELVSLDDGTVARIDGRHLAVVAPETGVERRRVPLPGVDCSLHRARGSVRAVCRHDGWATAVFSLDDGATTWSTLRDESRAEPMGAARFDPRSRAWAVAAPCRQRTEPDSHRACVYDDAGAAHEHRLPFAAAPVFVSGGVALFVDAEGRRAGPTAGALVQGGTLLRVELPVGLAGASLASAQGRALLAWDVDPATTSTRALLRGVRDGDAWRWTRQELPPGTRRAMVTPGGFALAAGATAAGLAMSDGGPFRPMPPVVEGAAAAVPMDLDGPWFCAGPWCRLGRTLTWSASGARETFLARRTTLPAPEPQPARVAFECRPAGPALPGVEMDRGSAVSGYALVARLSGDAVALRWYGATLRGAATVRWPGAAGELFRAVGVVGAHAPVALLERCDGGRCERAVATPAGVVAVALPRTLPGTAALHPTDDGYLARADHPRDGVGVVTLLRLAPDGSERGRRTYAFVPADAPVAAGTLRGAAGLWLPAGATRLRFHPLDGGQAVEVEDSREGCAPGIVAEGELHRIRDAAGVRGEGWAVAPDEWQVEERDVIAGGRACIASVAGGEPRDEPEEEAERERMAVRTFVLDATGPGVATARAWAGHALDPQRCELRRTP